MYLLFSNIFLFIEAQFQLVDICCGIVSIEIIKHVDCRTHIEKQNRERKVCKVPQTTLNYTAQKKSFLKTVKGGVKQTSKATSNKCFCVF